MKNKSNWLSILLVVLQILVALATFRHSAIGFASIEGGSNGGDLTTLLWGGIAALAIDAGMILSATGLRKKRSRIGTFWLVTGLSFSAVASTYTQWLFAILHAELVTIAPGAIFVQEFATNLSNARIFILPPLLPALAIIYAMASEVVNDAASSEEIKLRSANEQMTEMIADQRNQLSIIDNDRTVLAKRVTELTNEMNGLQSLLPEMQLIPNYARVAVIEVISQMVGIKSPSAAEIAQVINASQSTVARGKKMAKLIQHDVVNDNEVTNDEASTIQIR